jgi:hypothetical protein
MAFALNPLAESQETAAEGSLPGRSRQRENLRFCNGKKAAYRSLLSEIQMEAWGGLRIARHEHN